VEPAVPTTSFALTKVENSKNTIINKIIKDMIFFAIFKPLF